MDTANVLTTIAVASYKHRQLVKKGTKDSEHSHHFIHRVEFNTRFFTHRKPATYITTHSPASPIYKKIFFQFSSKMLARLSAEKIFFVVIGPV
jgi:hypothetical protein